MAGFESEIRVYSTSLEAYSPALIAGMLCISLSNILSLYVCLVYMKMFLGSSSSVSVSPQGNSLLIKALRY